MRQYPAEPSSTEQLNWLDLRGNQFDDEQQPVFQITFPGLDIQTKHVDELNGLSMWGRGSNLYPTEERRLTDVQFLSAVSVEKGFLKLDEERLPADAIDRVKESIKFVNSYLQESDTRVNTISDLERMFAKAQKRALTNFLKQLEAGSSEMEFGTKK